MSSDGNPPTDLEKFAKEELLTPDQHVEILENLQENSEYRVRMQCIGTDTRTGQWTDWKSFRTKSKYGKYTILLRIDAQKLNFITF